MPGLVPGIYVFGRYVEGEAWMAGTSPVTTSWNCGAPKLCGGQNSHPPRHFFIIFVDAMFTISLERLFTKPFEAVAPTATFPCVYRACNPD